MQVMQSACSEMQCVMDVGQCFCCCYYYKLIIIHDYESLEDYSHRETNHTSYTNTTPIVDHITSRGLFSSVKLSSDKPTKQCWFSLATDINA
jgi:hypothetical protein